MLDTTLLQFVLTEDLGSPPHDVTTELLFPNTQTPAHAKIVSKHTTPVTVCGMAVVHQILEQLSEHFSLHSDYKDGDQIMPGATLLNIDATAQTLLKAERTLLNFLRHLSGIATLTHTYVDCVKGTSLKILDTRKTTPGLRQLEKYAVQCGGGVNHRAGLYDAIMIKDTHIDLFGSMEQTLHILINSDTRELPVIVEVRSVAELNVVLKLAAHKVTRVLLDNMSLEDMRLCVARCQGIMETEASGNIRLDTVLAIAQTGVDYASVGELTYNAGQVDLSMYT